MRNQWILKRAKNWDEFLNQKEIQGMPSKRKAEFDSEVTKAKTALEALNPSYFSYKLPRHERWRLLPHFKEKLVFLDIETTGLSPKYSYTTVVGIHHSGKTKLLVRGEDLSEETLVKELDGRIPVTFNGSMFDLPFLSTEFPSLSFAINIDLRFVCSRLGYYGGLKSIEHQLGLARDSELEGMNGYMAVVLWKEWEKHGNKESLVKLLKYNMADVDNLIVLADIVYGKMKERK
jgi:hypothetical protein